MISYEPLWETMKQKGFTTYTLREKHKISGSTIQRLKNNQSVSTNTINDLCTILNCKIEEIAIFTLTEQI